MKLTILLLSFAMAVSALAQTALVVPLSRDDAAMLNRLHQEMLVAEQHWHDAQDGIRTKYLVVDKDDPDASDHKWYLPDDTSVSTWQTITFASSGSLSSYKCETADEKKARTAEEAKWRAEQKKRDDEREAKSRRVRKGWSKCGNCVGGGETMDFEYTTDFKYIVPARPLAPAVNPYIFSMPGTFTSPSALPPATLPYPLVTSVE